MMRKSQYLFVGISLLLLALCSSCEKKSINADGTTGGNHTQTGNLPPVTHLFLYPDSTGLDTSSSVLQLHWWGDDPDGWVVGYYLRWDYFETSPLLDSIWLPFESALFYLPLDTAFDNFTVTVKAVDNSASWNWPEGTMLAAAEGGSEQITAGILDYIEWEAFLDRGSEPEVYDTGDSLIWAGNIEGVQTQPGTELIPYIGGEISPYLLPPTNSTGAMDLTGASLLFPIRNTPPVVDFRIESNPTLNPGDIYKTFPTRSFFWEATDLDGNETIDSCYYALDPLPGDTSWITLAGDQTSVTLSDLPASNSHRFFLFVQDIAGARSPIVRFPASDSSYWQVVEPISNLLIVDDYVDDTNNQALNFYKTIFDSLTGIGGQYSVWEVGANLPYSNGDLLATLSYFDRVYWYTFYGLSNYPQALGTLSTYLENGGTLLISASQLDTASGVVPVDSFDVGTLLIGPPNSFISVQEGWPDLQFSQFFSKWIYGLKPSAQGEVLYEFGPGAIWQGAPPDFPGVSVHRTDDWKFTYIGAPLHWLNGSGTLPQFFTKALIENSP
ncbi:MAG: hypothetical protein NTW14_05415 [bacterium]|nr:hypothetical protein [bacterium]